MQITLSFYSKLQYKYYMWTLMNWKSRKLRAIIGLIIIEAIAIFCTLVALGLIGVPSYPQIVINLEFLKKDPSTGKFFWCFRHIEQQRRYGWAPNQRNCSSNWKRRYNNFAFWSLCRKRPHRNIYASIPKFVEGMGFSL